MDPHRKFQPRSKVKLCLEVINFGFVQIGRMRLLLVRIKVVEKVVLEVPLGN